MKQLLSISFIILITFSCKKESNFYKFKDTDAYILSIPIGFPSPEIPKDNLLSKSRVELGKKLFFDPILSNDLTISCASCHFPNNAFSDTVSISSGVLGRKGMRNSPSLINLVYKPAFFMDGGVPTLELQVMAPIQDHNEMDLNILDAIERLKNDKEYVELSAKAYNREPDGFVLTRAIAAYERTLISGNSDYDKFINGEIASLTLSQKRGKDLFFGSKTNCSSCHGGFNFTNYKYENIGLYPNYRDSGRMRITLDEQDRGKFMVPSLRNISVTAPYMHDGSINTLADVIDFFDQGGHLNSNKSNLVSNLNLTIQEKQDIENFLSSLTDNKFISNNKKIE